MRYCGRLFNDSRERTGRKVRNVSWTGQLCSAYTRCVLLSLGTRKMYSAYAWCVLLSLAECFKDRGMFQGLVCTVHTWSIYAWCEYESLCVLLSLAECFKDWSVRGKSSQSRNWGMQLYLFDKQPWKMKDNIYSFRVCNFCYGGQRMQSWHRMRYCGRVFNDSRERTRGKLQNVSGTGQMYSAYTWTGLYTHGVNIEVCVFCYLLWNVSRTGQMYNAYIGGRKS
ncbi:uncharacterized protein LOC123202716 isoform X1 [Mangifera indica]|uniref:uncharacterized protein LOC123202716 isoform X1 n=1 Tax=Mangifera indica TaxID=29780 RepID=UPI001CFAAB2E|nr:uncharacterized protein LOC123202716 isoform X1 [Mangifera indica]